MASALAAYHKLCESLNEFGSKRESTISMKSILTYTYAVLTQLAVHAADSQ